jgi:hypothetical protein
MIHYQFKHLLPPEGFHNGAVGYDIAIVVDRLQQKIVGFASVPQSFGHT